MKLYDKYIKQRKYINGVATDETRAGDLFEIAPFSGVDGCQSGQAPQSVSWSQSFRNVDIEGEYECVGFDKYTKANEEISIDGGVTWFATGRTLANTLVEANSTDCGYVPPTQYRWVTVEGEYECVGYDKYTKEKEQISTDNGSTWSDTGETRAGSLVEENSADCGYAPEPQYRWITAEGEYECVNFNKYAKEKEQVSNDNGVTWSDTGNTRTGSLIEENSADCGYAPEPISTEWTLTDDFSNISGSILKRSDTSGFTVSQGSQSNTCVINGSGTKIRFYDKIVHARYLDASNLTSLKYLLSGSNYLITADLRGWDISNVTTMEEMFAFDTGGGSVTSVNMSNLDASSVTTMYEMFYNCRSLTSVNLSGLNASNCTNMSRVFENCYALTDINLANINTSSVTSVYNMFQYCSKLETLDLSSFDTSNIVSATSMFDCCSSLKYLDLSNFDLSRITTYTYYRYMFSSCSKLETIKTNAAFRDWCIARKTVLGLPEAFYDASYSGWVIV